MAKQNFFKLIIALAVCQLAGVIGSLFTAPAISGWYASLAKPAFNPPGWLFGPVWIILYLMMGLALYLIWRKNNRLLVWLFFGHLFFNAVWSILFFGLQAPLLAFIDIILLWLLIIVLIVRFRPASKAAAYLLIPYLYWVSFALVLNYAIWRLN